MTKAHPLERSLAWKSLLAFTLPNIAILVFHASYTIVDGIFVSNFVGEMALSSLNMVWPILCLMYGFTFMLAIGGSALVAQLQGEGKRYRSRGLFSMLVACIIILSLLYMGVGLYFLDELVSLTRCTPAQHELGKQYLAPLLLLAPGMMLQLSFQVFFVTAGKPALGMLCSILAGLGNIIMDYMFIVKFGWGLSGAAWATGLGACIPAIFGLLYFSLMRKSELRLTRPLWIFSNLWKVCINGSSEMVTNCAAAIVTFLFNYSFLKYYGESGVAAIAVALYFQFFFTCIFFGFSEGVAPLISYQFGKNNKRGVRRGLRSSLSVLACMGVLTFSLCILTLDFLLPIFIPETTKAYALVREGFPIFAIAFIYMWFSVFASAFFTALGDGLISAVISLGRNIILTSVIIILPLIFGINGIWMSLPVAEFFAFLLAYYLLRRKRKQYGY